mgnify:CR=1 FL=1
MKSLTPKQQHWTSIIDDWSKSGLSQAAYCREHNLDPQLLYRWKHDLGKNSRCTASNAEFLPLAVVEDSANSASIVLHIANIEIDGTVFLSELDQTYRSGKGPIKGKSFNYSYGVGTQLSKMQFGDYRVVNILSTTPIEDTWLVSPV